MMEVNTEEDIQNVLPVHKVHGCFLKLMNFNEVALVNNFHIGYFFQPD
jgi:hypothetical protein